MSEQQSAMSKRHFLQSGCALLVLPLARVAAAASAAYPAMPISVTVPYAPGGQGDLFARMLSEPLSKALAQTVVVENRPGASGMLGTRLIIRQKPDGHHLLLGQTGEIAINPVANPNAGYQALEALEPVVLVGDSPLVLITASGSPFQTIGDLLAKANQAPESVNYASSGTATPGHLAAVALELSTNTKMTHVPYKGAGQAMTDVIGGQVDCFFSSVSAAMGHIKSGSVRALATTTGKRLAALKDTPTVAEATVPGFNYSLWGGYFAPAGTPKDVILQLNREINKILAQPAIRARLDADGAAVEANSPEKFAEFVKAEISKYSTLIQSAGIVLE
jgi:tripartite-type tricarboxylate transporter receptor subunit TctC